MRRRNGQLSDILFHSLNNRLNDMSIVLSGCERIATTPVPFAYTLILHRTVYLFCIMLPFALVVDLHYMTPFVSALISYTFISLDTRRKSWKTRLAQKITTCRWTPSAT